MGLPLTRQGGGFSHAQKLGCEFAPPQTFSATNCTNVGVWQGCHLYVCVCVCVCVFILAQE